MAGKSSKTTLLHVRIPNETLANMKQKACDTGRTLSNVAAVALGNAFPEIGLFDDLRPEPAPVVETTKQRLDRYIEEHRRRARETADAADQETEARPPEI